MRFRISLLLDSPELNKSTILVDSRNFGEFSSVQILEEIMNYEEFKAMWNALVANRAPRHTEGSDPTAIPNGASERTLSALAHYGRGEKTVIQGVRSRLSGVSN